jgi:hypothetical protein
VLIVLSVESMNRYLPVMQWVARILILTLFSTYNAWILPVFVVDLSTGIGGFHS